MTAFLQKAMRGMSEFMKRGKAAASHGIKATYRVVRYLLTRSQGENPAKGGKRSDKSNLWIHEVTKILYVC